MVVRVGRRALGVPELAAGALVDRRVAVGGERVRVVAGGDVEAAVGAEGQRAGGVAALLALGCPGEDDLLGLGAIVLFAPTVKRETRVWLFGVGAACR